MKRIAIGMSALTVVLAVGAVVQASIFEVPPELNMPGWVTQYPYQRNIDWTFDTNPLGGPTTNGAPGADYSGYDDPDLWDSDFFTYYGDVQWFDQVDMTPYGLSVYQGMVGIINDTPNPLSGTVIVHIDNWPDPRPIKNVWTEFDFIVSDASVLEYVDMSMQPAPGSTVTGGGESAFPWPLPNGLLRQNSWMVIEPNPPYEELVIDVTGLPPGEFILMDRIHVATECVPEPGTLALGAFALFGLAVFARRRRV